MPYSTGDTKLKRVNTPGLGQSRLPSPSIAASVLPSVAMLALSSLSSTSFAGPALRATVQAPAPVQMVALDELKGLAKAQVRHARGLRSLLTEAALPCALRLC